MNKIPPFKLQLVPLNEEAKNLPPFEYAPEEVGSRHQLGGDPEFIQDTEKPCCKSCNNAMTFYAQLDSINDDFNLVDCGMIYVFVCFDCFEVESLLQSY